MTVIISFGVLLALALCVLCLAKWWNVVCVGTMPVGAFTFLAILFTSGLDVGLIMLPLTEFPGYRDLTANPEYGFANPLAIEFAYWGFLIWAFYFLTSFYFCVIEPRVGFFEILAVKIVHNIVIIATCAFTAHLLLRNLPWYLSQAGDGDASPLTAYGIVLAVIVAAALSSTSIRSVRRLSVASVGLFCLLIGLVWGAAGIGFGELAAAAGLLGDYFSNLHRFVLPLNQYHEFYLFWWFAWSVMVGQFTARFVGGLRTWQLFLALLIVPSVPLAIWFGVLYRYDLQGLSVQGPVGLAMVVVGVLFVVNSLDSLIRLYTDNLGLTSGRVGRRRYLAGNVGLLASLALLFQLDFLRIEWVGALVIGLYVACVGYIVAVRRGEVWSITDSPPLGGGPVLGQAGAP